ncbi:hypothetical protein F2Q68_00032768 [Brassica cretica]|uniref:Uncharacterized protein n=1 Tax=Brassica cretica TaxID=69181 RepID=A0A8S9GFE4_BRACR|nr:hypothetical protein F2Q68_00032768 [Brassica cretica]
MEFLETFGCIWNSKEVIRMIFGRALPGATSRSDYMKSLCTTSRSDFPGATARSRSRMWCGDTKIEHPGATSQSALPRSLPARATSPERPAQSDYLKSLQPERPAQVARVLTGRDTKKRVGSDLLERLC